MLSSVQSRPFTFMQDGKPVEVCPQRCDVADSIDLNHDGCLDDDELKQYMLKQGILKQHCDVDEAAVLNEFKAYLQETRGPQNTGYHTYQQVGDDLQALADKYPDLCQRVSLGKTHEGRDIWALKISKDVTGDTSKRPGVVFTGAIHAREWMSMETPLQLAHKLVEGYATDPHIQKDVDSAEIWIVPCVNPDGYEYSRTQDRMWRKNRQPVDNSACSTNGATSLARDADDGQTTGVDCNRNFDDGDPAHEVLYRPVGDLPCRTDDDFGETSDDPDSDTYRGPHGASELEVQAMLKLELGRPNIIGVIDHHAYGNDILRPWGHTKDDPDRLAEYLDCGNQMNKAMDQPFTLEASDDMYPTSGDSTDCLHAAGIMAYTVELGRSFQPPASQIPSMTANVNKADVAFLDWIIEHKTGVTRQPLASIPPFSA